MHSPMIQLHRAKSLGSSALIALAGLLVSGCGSGNFGTVNGTVSLDGKPLEGGNVAFYATGSGPVSYGTIGADGSYHLRSASRDSVVVGSYVATISYRSGRPSPGMTVKEIEALEKVPVKYCTKDKSDLKVDVQPGKNSIDLKLTTSN
jgi:hypothetical protein